jgi:hypothetical protein
MPLRWNVWPGVVVDHDFCFHSFTGCGGLFPYFTVLLRMLRWLRQRIRESELKINKSQRQMLFAMLEVNFE